MIYFVRHGESEANLRGVFAGQKDDSDLTVKGREQAHATAMKINKEGIVVNAIFSSHLKRAIETAQIIAQEIGFDHTHISIDARIAEYDMGARTGTSLKEMKSLELISAEGAEDPELFNKRIHDALIEYSKLPGNTLVVSHGGVGRMLETIKEGKDVKLFYDRMVWQNASVTLIDWVK